MLIFDRSGKPGTQPSPLTESFEAALAYRRDRAETLRLASDQLAALASDEAAFRQITVDENGLSDGTRLHLVGKAAALVSEWRSVRSHFDSAIRPKLADLHALADVEQEIVRRRSMAVEQAAQAERGWEKTPGNLDLRNRRDEADNRYRHLLLRHGNRTANMRAYNPVYWLAMLCIGIAEWLINYDTFLIFVGIPAIAAGATVILGVLLAFAAHGHGELLKQWSFRFGQAQRTIDKVGGYRLLALSTLGLIVVLIAAGASRYSAALHMLSSVSGGGGLLQQDLDINPLRDVLISLLANLGAWIVGVFLSYLCHDVDPDFMAATRQWWKASRRFNRARRKVGNELSTIEARVERDERESRVAAQSRVDSVAVEQSLLDRLTLHENGIMEAIAGVLRSNAEHYRDALSKAALASKGEVTITQLIGGEARPLTPYAYKSMRIQLDAAFVRSLAN